VGISGARRFSEWECVQESLGQCPTGEAVAQLKTQPLLINRERLQAKLFGTVRVCNVRTHTIRSRRSPSRRARASAHPQRSARTHTPAQHKHAYPTHDHARKAHTAAAVTWAPGAMGQRRQARPQRIGAAAGPIAKRVQRGSACYLSRP
jgi:hypothetical protein